MMEDEKRNQVLFDYLSGSLSLDEMVRVESWMEESEENRMYFVAFRRDFLRMHCGMRMGMVKGTWEGFERRRRLRVVRRISAWAALVACVIGVGLAWFVRTTEDDLFDAEVARIVPGKMQAQLTLSSGVRVVLDGSSRQLKEVNEMSIYVEEDGVMNYTGQRDEGGEVLYNTVKTPRGGEYAIVLADSTKVWLNAGTEFRFPVYFSGNRREVYLNGEAYFDVSKDERKPFVVHAGEVKVQVYGTEFNVNNYKAGQVETVLVEGQVGMSEKGKEVRLAPGEKGTFVEGGVKIERVDVYAYIAWKEGSFVFEDERLEEIMEKLARWYDVEVFYAREEAREECLSGDMMRYKDIRSLLYYFERISDVRFEIKGKSIVVK